MKILLYVANGIGDFMISLPLIYAIKKHNKEAVIDIFTAATEDKFKIIKQLVELEKNINKSFYYSKKELFHSIKLMYDFSFKKYDIGIVLEHSNSRFLSNWPSRIINYACKKTIGPRNCFVNAKYDVVLERDDRYSVFEYEKDILSAINIDVALFDHMVAEFSLPAVATNEFENEKGIVGFCIGAGPVANEKEINPLALSKKSWKIENWLSLADRLIESGIKVVLFGGSIEKEMMSSVQHKINKKIINLIGTTSLPESFSIIKNLDLVVGVDTGMVHACAILGGTTLTLFGCSDFKVVLPYGNKSYFITKYLKCSPCFGTDRVLSCEVNNCMLEISVDEVENKIYKILENSLAKGKL